MSLLSRALFWGLLPVVAAQGLYVRRIAPRFAPAEGDTFGTAGADLPGPGLSLLALGDSIVAGVGAGRMEQAFAAATARALSVDAGSPVRWVAVGRSGADAREVSDELMPRAVACAADIPPIDAVIVSVGVNDLTGLRRSGQWARDLSRVLDQCRQACPEAAVALSGLPPMQDFPLLPQPLRRLMGLRARRFTEVAAEVVAARPGMVLVPLAFDPAVDAFADDGFHPGPASYARLGAAMAAALKPRLS